MKVFALDLSDPNVNPTASISNVNILFSTLLSIAKLVGFAVFIISGLYGTFLIITAGSNSEKIDKGKKTITYSILGIILIALSVLITEVLGFIFNFNFNF